MDLSGGIPQPGIEPGSPAGCLSHWTTRQIPVTGSRNNRTPIFGRKLVYWKHGELSTKTQIQYTSSFSRENLRRHYVEILYVKLHTLVYWKKKKKNYQVLKIDSFFLTKITWICITISGVLQNGNNSSNWKIKLIYHIRNVTISKAFRVIKLLLHCKETWGTLNWGSHLVG